MKRSVLASAALLLMVAILTNCNKGVDDDSKYSGTKFTENIRSTEARSPEEELAGFKVPPGFEIQLFASEPNIDKPINLAFDAKGRMWVTSSFEYPFPSSKTPHGSDRITMLEDTDHDGRADKFTDVVDTVNIPIGILPLNSSAVTFSIPNLYQYSDLNNDGTFDRQKVLLGPFGYRDTHGMVSNFMRGYDGWVHACHGFTNRSTVAGTDGDSIKMVSGNTFRFRLDGSRVEQLTFGQVNPFGLVFDAYGYVYSTDSHSSPLYQLIRGADYPHFERQPIMAFGPDMKPLENEATALCGISQYADVKFPPEFQGNFFIGDVVNCRVHRYSYVLNGSSPVGKSEVDFIKSEDPWFRPVNIKLGPDGAIYVADFYNAIIGHYEVPLGHPKRDKSRGRIWRITYKGEQNKPIDFTALSLQELLNTLDHHNLPTRMMAADQVADRIGTDAVAPLTKALDESTTSPRKFIHCLWLLHRLNSLSSDMLKRSAAHPDPLVRLHTMRVLSEQKPDLTYSDLAVQALGDKDAHVQRAATELIMKYPSVRSVQSVLALQHVVPQGDNHMIYTTQLCLRNMLRNESLLTEVVGMKWNDTDAASIAFVLVDVPSPTAAEFLASYANRNSLPKDKLPIAYGRITRFIPEFKLEAVFSGAMKMYVNDVQQRALIFQGFQEGMAQRGKKMNGKVFKEAGSDICAELIMTYPSGTRLKSDESIALQRFAVILAGEYAVASLEPELKRYLKSSTTNVDVRTASLRSLLRLDANKNMSLVGEVLSDDSTTLDLKKRVVTVAGEFPGSALNKVLAEVKHASSDVQIAIVLALSTSAEGKDLVFTKVRSGELNARTLLDPKVEERMQLNISQKQRTEFENLTSNLDPIDNERQTLIDQRLKAFKEVKLASLSLDSGSNVFGRNCSACHRRVSQVGTGIGPQLHGIGKRGDVALAEKILDPNRNISEAFRSYTIRLKDGKVLSGLLRREEGAVLVFADFAGNEFSVPKKDIVEQKASRFSVMPDNFGSTLSQDEFNALLAYLLSS